MTARRHGFALIDIITSLAVLGSLAVVGTQLFRTGLRLSQESVAAEESTIRMCSAIGAFRADVWNAKELGSKDSHSLQIAGADGNSMDWIIDGNDLVRSENGLQRRWIGVGEGCAFEADGPSVILRSVIRGETAQLRVVSQLQLARRETP
jgi:hypothetical protein